MATRSAQARWDGNFTEFERPAEETKQGCPVSKALGAVGEITLDAELEG